MPVNGPVQSIFRGKPMMRKILGVVTTSLLAYSQVSSFCCSFLPEVAESNLSLGVGYRQDELSWHTCGCTFDPHIKYEKINIWEIGLTGKYVTCDNIYVRGYADYGWITGGRRTETDYEFQTGQEFVSSCSSSSFTEGSAFVENDAYKDSVKGNVYDVSIALGYQFRWCDDSFAVSPIVGYSWDGQHLKGKANQDCFFSDDSVMKSSCSSYSYPSSYSSCSSSSSSSDSNSAFYRTRWNGPFIGVDLEYALWCDWTVFAGYEYHWARFHASSKTGNNTKFTQNASNANGQNVFVGTSYDFCDCWTLALIGEFGYWTTKGGHSTQTLASFDVDCDNIRTQSRTKLKEVKWETASISMDLGYTF